jgi:hypothetical protein
MNLVESIRIVALCTRGWPSWQPLDGTAEIWHRSSLHDLRYDDAEQAVYELIASEARWPTAADIRKRARAIAQDRVQRQPAVAIENIRTTEPGPEWHELRKRFAARRRPKDGQPARVGDAMPEVAQNVEQRAAQDAERMAQARAELAARQAVPTPDEETCEKAPGSAVGDLPVPDWYSGNPPAKTGAQNGAEQMESA